MIGRIQDGIRRFPERYGRITASHTYVPQIDGLRFIAVMLVVCFHAAFRGERAVLPPAELQQGILAYLPNGIAGVELFFFISGYIIAFPFLAGAAPSLRAFYGRRVYRLEPPYLLVLLGCFIVVTVAGSRVGYAPQFEKSDVPIVQSFLASCVYLHGLVFGAHPRLNPPMWSLELEIQFYLLAPFIIAGYKAIGERTRRMAVASVIALAFLIVQGTVPRLVPYAAFTIVCNSYAFLIGIIMCDWAVANDPFRMPARRRFDAVFLAGALLLLASSMLWRPWGENVVLGILNLLMRAASIVLLYVGVSRGPRARAVLGAPWIALIGGACYSIYLVHVPLMQPVGNFVFRLLRPSGLAEGFAIGLATLVPVSLIGGLVYYLLIERPCMRRDWPARLIARISGRAPRADRDTGTVPTG